MAKDAMLVALGRYLRTVREARKLSQDQLAHLAKVHRTYVGGVERAEYNVTLLTLRRFADALGITVLDAVKGMTEVQKRPRQTAPERATLPSTSAEKAPLRRPGHPTPRRAGR